MDIKKARQIIEMCHENPGRRCLIVDDRGFEFRIFPERFTVILIPAATVATMEQQARQQQPGAGGVVLPVHSTHQ